MMKFCAYYNLEMLTTILFRIFFYSPVTQEHYH
jgi:hypothetical protein